MKTLTSDKMEKEEWEAIKKWASGTTHDQREMIIAGVLVSERKGRRPHLRKLIEKAFNLAAAQCDFDNLEIDLELFNAQNEGKTND